MKSIIISVVIFTLLSSCISFKEESKGRYNTKVKDIYYERSSLFADLSKENINYRKNKDLTTFDNDWSYKNSVAAIIKEAIIDSIDNNKDFIKVDLRYYNNVGLGNIIFSAVKDEDLREFINFSKFDQQFFILFNFGKDKVTIINGRETPFDFRILHIYGDLQDKELVFNVSNSNIVQCNIKFTPEKPVFSFIADSVTTTPCDIRESSNFLQNLIYNVSTLDNIGGGWKMKLLSIKEANYVHDGGTPKFTGGVIENIMNQDVKKLEMGVFKDMKIIKYYDNLGKKFRYQERSD